MLGVTCCVRGSCELFESRLAGVVLSVAVEPSETCERMLLLLRMCPALHCHAVEQMRSNRRLYVRIDLEQRVLPLEVP